MKKKVGTVTIIEEPLNTVYHSILMANYGLNRNFEDDNPKFLRTYESNHGGRDPRKKARGRGGA